MSKPYIPNFFRAMRGSEIHYGTADEIGRLVDVQGVYIAKTANRLNNVTRTGWTVTRVLKKDAPPGYRNAAAQHYIATRDGEDPIMGDAEEIGQLIGVTASRVRQAESAGQKARGWTVIKASEEQVREFEAQWA